MPVLTKSELQTKKLTCKYCNTTLLACRFKRYKYKGKYSVQYMCYKCCTNPNRKLLNKKEYKYAPEQPPTYAEMLAENFQYTRHRYDIFCKAFKRVRAVLHEREMK